MMSQEIICSIALSNLPHVGLVTAKRLYEEVGSAVSIFEHRKHITDLIPDATPQLQEALDHCDDALKLAEKEYEYIEKKHINND